MEKHGFDAKKIICLLIGEEYYEGRTHFNSTITMLVNFIWATLKFIYGFVTHSWFFCVSGGYTLSIGFCKRVFLTGRKKAENKKDPEEKLILEKKYYLIISTILSFSGLLFSTYTSKLFIWPEHSINVGLNLSIFIAFISFLELFLSLRGLYKLRKANDILMIALKAVSLTSALTSIVLTQKCLLEATFQSETEKIPFYNALTGTIVGILCMIISFQLRRRIHKQNIPREDPKYRKQQE